MKLKPLIPLLILVSWQPSQVQRPDGKYRIAYGYGASHFIRDYNWFGSDAYCSGGGGCSGTSCTLSQPYLHHDTRKESYDVRAVQVEMWPSDLWRISGSLGSAGGNVVGGVIGAYEARSFGVGAGLSASGGATYPSGPALYLRLGDLNAGHLRGELLPAGPIWGAGGTSRAGLAYNLGQRHGWGWFVGYASSLGHAGLTGPPNPQGAAFAELVVPFVATSSILLSGHTGNGTAGFGMGFRVGFGR